MAVTLQGSTLNNIHIGNSGAGGGGGAISAVNSASDSGSWNTSSTTWTTAGRTISVTATTGSSVLITLSVGMATMDATNGNTSYAGVAVSGASTIAATDARAASQAGIAPGLGGVRSRTFVLSGLTPGLNTFTMQFRVDGKQFAFWNADLVVQTLA